MALGWKLGDWKAGYKVRLPNLSNEEQELVSAVSERFREQTQRREVESRAEAEKIIGKLLASECEEQGIGIDSDQKDYLSRAAYLQTYGLGFLGELLSDESLEEIAVIGLGSPVYVFVRNSGWKRTNVAIESQDYFVSLVNRLGRGLGRRLTAQQPRLNAVLEGGGRVHASMPPVSSCELTIRKFSREPFTPFDLLSFGTYDARTLAILSLAVQADLPVLFAGNTASGKTSSLNALLAFIPASERVLLIEETPEISIPHPHQLRLIPFEESGIGMVELVRDSLRMRPDRVVVGEVRQQQEARAFVESALSGQAKGCYTTFHAQSARDAALRLRMMGCMEADLEGIEVFIVQRRVSSYDARKRKLGEVRKVTEIAVANPADVMKPLTVFNGSSYSAQATGKLMEKVATGTGMSLTDVKKEIAGREKFLKKNRGTKGFERSFNTIQKFLYGKEE